ncbi:MAG: heme exporter protein CcmD [Pseudomonadota bacterium]
MDWNAAHISFVIAAYAVSFAGLAFLMVFILLRDRKLKRQIAALDRGKDRRDG